MSESHPNLLSSLRELPGISDYLNPDESQKVYVSPSRNIIVRGIEGVEQGVRSEVTSILKSRSDYLSDSPESQIVEKPTDPNLIIGKTVSFTYDGKPITGKVLRRSLYQSGNEAIFKIKNPAMRRPLNINFDQILGVIVG